MDNLARSQHGLLTRSQLAALGATKKARLSLISHGLLIPVRREVYRCAGTAPSWEGAVLAAVLAAGRDPVTAGRDPVTAGRGVAGRGPVASHVTAAQLWGLVGPDAWPRAPVVHLTSPHQHRLDGVVAHRRTLGPDQVTARRRIPVTSVARTIVDLASEPLMTRRRLGSVVDDALRRQILRLADLRALASPPGPAGKPVRRLIREVLADRRPGYAPGANDWERAMDQWWDQVGLPQARRQYRLHASGRKFVIDRAIVDLKIAVEWNGFSHHGDRTGFDRDAERQLALVAEEWIYLPVTTNTSPRAVCQAVAGAVAQRQQAVAGAPRRGPNQ